MSMLLLAGAISAIIFLAASLSLAAESYEAREERRVADLEQLKFRQAVRRKLHHILFIISTFAHRPEPLQIRERVFPHLLDNQLHIDPRQ